MRRIPHSARIVHDLVVYDGPQLELLKSAHDHFMFGIAVDTSIVESTRHLKSPFFACEARDKVYERYFSQSVDLHFVFAQAIGGEYYWYDLDTSSDAVVSLTKATSEEVTNLSFWPDTGFFAASHTTNYNIAVRGSATRNFNIDGKWVASDFSHFHGKMSDLYALFVIVRALEHGDSGAQINVIRGLVKERFWRGGGSYVGFYDDLIERADKLHVVPLDVAKIQYSSPGQISLNGDGEALSDISDVIATFNDHEKDMVRLYKSVYAVLRKERLLRAMPNHPFGSKVLEDVTLRNVMALATAMQLERQQDILAACDDNTLVFAKVIMSIFRRAKDLHAFQAEGRVQPVTA